MYSTGYLWVNYLLIKTLGLVITYGSIMMVGLICMEIWNQSLLNGWTISRALLMKASTWICIWELPTSSLGGLFLCHLIKFEMIFIENKQMLAEYWSERYCTHSWHFSTKGLDPQLIISISRIHECLRDQFSGPRIVTSSTPQAENGKRLRGKERIRRKGGMGKQLRKDCAVQYNVVNDCGTTWILWHCYWRWPIASKSYG